jgi:alkanesulfonate monooxygenase SsuD/methylene tetrahydromethanopterin reductase-like flavin-dependent oxidoreductase (luciferase family)
MDFGILLPFRNPAQWHAPITKIYDEHIEEAVLAEELGYDHVWTTEHHFYDDAWSPSLLPILAAIAQRTSRIRLGTFIIILPFHHPVRVAEDAATVDILSKGRLDLGLGQGYVVSEFESFRIPRRERAARLEEGSELIRRCFTEENFSSSGKFYPMENVNLTPKPVQKPYPPIWIAAMAEKSVTRAARLGFHLAGSGGTDLQRFYDSALQEFDRDPKDHHIAQLRAVYVAETREQAWDDAEQHLYYMMSAYDRRLKEAADLPWSQAVFSCPQVPPPGEMRKTLGLTFFQAPLVVGSPEDVAHELPGCRRRRRAGRCNSSQTRSCRASSESNHAAGSPAPTSSQVRDIASNPTNRNNSVEKSDEYIYRPANRSCCPTERQT